MSEKHKYRLAVSVEFNIESTCDILPKVLDEIRETLITKFAEIDATTEITIEYDGLVNQIISGGYICQVGVGKKDNCGGVCVKEYFKVDDDE